MSFATAPGRRGGDKMTNTSKSGDKKLNNNLTNNLSDSHTIPGEELSSWSRRQKIAMIAYFGLLGLLLVVSACSKQSAKPALVAASSPAAVPTAPPEAALSAGVPPQPEPLTSKTMAKKRP